MAVHASVSFRDEMAQFKKIEGVESVRIENLAEFIQKVMDTFFDEFLCLKKELVEDDREMYDTTMYIHYYHDTGFAFEYEPEMNEIAFSMYPASFYRKRLNSIEKELFNLINTHQNVSVTELVTKLITHFDINFKR